MLSGSKEAQHYTVVDVFFLVFYHISVVNIFCDCHMLISCLCVQSRACFAVNLARKDLRILVGLTDELTMVMVRGPMHN